MPSLLLLLLVLSGCATTPSGREPDSAEALYAAGSQALETEDYPGAIRYFQELELFFPDDRHSVQGQMEIVYAYYQSGDHDSAIAAAGRFIRKHPDHPQLDYLYYLRGLAGFDQAIPDLGALTSTTSARPPTVGLTLQYFAELIGRYPQSRYNADARNRIAHLRQLLAQHELEAAKQHINLGEYTSAGLRARSVIEHYPDSGLATEAATVANMANRMLNLEGALRDPDPAQLQELPTPEPTTEPAPETIEVPDPAVDIRREDWLNTQDPDVWTIQLLGTENEQSLRNFIREHNLTEAAYYALTRDEQRWYSLVYGLFDDIDAARAAAERLPRVVLGDNPWIRRLGDVQAVIDLEQRME